MQEGLEFLKTLDVKDIHAKTHISLFNINAILNEEFHKIEPIHFAGFVAILEREYEIDLSDLKIKYSENSPEHVSKRSIIPSVIVKESSENSSKKGWLLTLILIIGAVVAFLFVSETMSNKKSSLTHKEVNDSQIEEAKEKIQDTEAITPYLVENENNISVAETIEENGTIVAEENSTMAEELNATAVTQIIDEIAPEIDNEIVTIVPRKKVWIGMIELATMKKINRVTTKQIKVDSSKDWLIVFGHGQVNIQKDDQLLELNDSNKVYFIYENGKLKQIDRSEFKLHNQGKTW